MEENLDNKMIPVVTLRDIVVFPGTTVYFEVGRESTIKAVSEAMNSDKMIFTVAQKDQHEENPGLEPLPPQGVCRCSHNMSGKCLSFPSCSHRDSGKW